MRSVDSRIRQIVIKGDSRDLEAILVRRGLPEMDFCITSPPYWNQLKNNHRRQVTRLHQGLRTDYGGFEGDLGQIDDYETFLAELSKVFDAVYTVLKDRSYFVVIANNVYSNGRVWPLAFDIFELLSKKWVPKDEMIWCQDNKQLFPFGMFDTYVGNRSHHYCLVFQKLSNKDQ
jgi:DNA modification methylase